MLLARSLAGSDLRWLVAGSDGQDAMTPYAGAEADGTSWGRIDRAEAEKQLAAFQSAALAQAIGKPIPSFASGTNLTDLVLIARGTG
jgi:glycerate-2-kinase